MKPFDEKILIKESSEAYELLDKSTRNFFIVDDKGKFKNVMTKKEIVRKYIGKSTEIKTNIYGLLGFLGRAFLAVDKNSRILIINDEAKSILKIENEDIIGRKIEDLIPSLKNIKTMEVDKNSNNKTILFKNKKIQVDALPINNKTFKMLYSFKDISKDNEIENKLVSEKNEKEILNTIFETAYDGLIVIDAEGYITMMSDAYKKFLGVEEEEIVGKHVTKVIENTRMHIVAKTGIAEIAELHKIKDNYMVASRFPVFKDGVVTSVVGKVMFRNVEELQEIYKKTAKMEEQLENYKKELNKLNRAKYNFKDIKGTSKSIRSVIKTAKKSAHTDSSILITGESGTGKELFAHSIHNSSLRKEMPFIKVNCAAIPEDLLESELFGYEQGAFTGAKKGGKIGKFEVADKGTIFLDEIGDMSLHMQAKLLRVIQERELEKIGSNNPKSVDVRIIAATNRNLKKMIEEKKFRLDLYYRLNVVNLKIPPLRDRVEDIEVLCKNFIDKYSIRYLKRVDGIEQSALSKLKKYSWPGNIRELENIIERAINIMDESKVIKRNHLPIDISEVLDKEQIGTLNETMEAFERKTIEKCLDAVNYNKSEAARILDISRTALYKKIYKYKLNM